MRREARDPEKTIPRATYLSVLLIGGFFVFTTWLMVAGVGAQELIPSLKALSDPTSTPLDSAVGLKAWGAWEGAPHEGN